MMTTFSLGSSVGTIMTLLLLAESETTEVLANMNSSDFIFMYALLLYERWSSAGSLIERLVTELRYFYFAPSNCGD